MLTYYLFFSFFLSPSCFAFRVSKILKFFKNDCVSDDNIRLWLCAGVAIEMLNVEMSCCGQLCN